MFGFFPAMASKLKEWRQDVVRFRRAGTRNVDSLYHWLVQTTKILRAASLVGIESLARLAECSRSTWQLRSGSRLSLWQMSNGSRQETRQIESKNKRDKIIMVMVSILYLLI